MAKNCDRSLERAAFSKPRSQVFTITTIRADPKNRPQSYMKKFQRANERVTQTLDKGRCIKVARNSFSTYILIGRYNHSLSLDAIIMASKNCLTICEHVVTIFVTQ